jgi:hypothetical protein
MTSTMRAIATGLRGFFFVLLLATATGKLLDNRGFAEIVGSYQLGLADGLGLPLALAVSLVELALAWALLRGSVPLLTAAGVAVMHAGYSALSLVTLLRGIALDNCGCFGVYLARPLTWQTVFDDGALTALALLYAWLVARGAQPPHGRQQQLRARL